jgi:anthranilate synthase component II
MNILLIDNFDSFTFNLCEEFQSRGCHVEVWRNDISADEALLLAYKMQAPRLIVLSSGPGSPKEAGCCVELIQKSQGKIPILGVCLGHQAIVEAFGGSVGSAESIMHGKISLIAHDGQDVFSDLPSQLSVARYHSLVATQLPDSLKTRAFYQNLVMAVSHVTYPILGLQFHPESVLTTMGGKIIENILAWAKASTGSIHERNT